MASKETRIYDIINKKAGSNIAMQGISGLFGFPFTLAVDVFFPQKNTFFQICQEWMK